MSSVTSKQRFSPRNRSSRFFYTCRLVITYLICLGFFFPDPTVAILAACAGVVSFFFPFIIRFKFPM